MAVAVRADPSIYAGQATSPGNSHPSVSPVSLSPFYYHPFVLSKGLFKFTSLYVYASSAYDQFALLTAQIYN